jgi:pimeloyl-ACP methyl ester carboxylesterase
MSYHGFLTSCIETKDFFPAKYPYDWRLPLSASIDGLINLVNKTWQENGQSPIHIVAHSMGGLLVRLALHQYPNMLKHIGRIVYLATPHFGSPAIAFYVRYHFRGTWSMYFLGKHISSKTFRSLWGPISLLPAPGGIYPTSNINSHPCGNFEFYDANAWEVEMTDEERESFQKALNAAREQHKLLHKQLEEMTQEERDKTAIIAGVGYEMPFFINAQDSWLNGKAKWNRKAGDIHYDGDGSVSLASSVIDVAEKRYCVCEHAEMPNVPAVSLDVFEFLRSQKMTLPISPFAANKKGRPSETYTSQTPHLDNSKPTDGSPQDISRWKTDEPDLKKLAEIEKRIDQGESGPFERVKLL